MIWLADEKTSLFSAHFDAKQCRDSFPQPYSSSGVEEHRGISITPVLSMLIEKVVVGKLSIFWKVTVCFLLLISRIVGV